MSHSYTSQRLQRGLRLMVHLATTQQTCNLLRAAQWLHSKSLVGHQHHTCFLNRGVRSEISTVLELARLHQLRLEGAAIGSHVASDTPMSERVFTENCKCVYCRQIRALHWAREWVTRRLTGRY